MIMNKSLHLALLNYSWRIIRVIIEKIDVKTILDSV